MALPSLLFGILSVLGPLHLSAAGWGAAAIGGGLACRRGARDGAGATRRTPDGPAREDAAVRVTLTVATLASLALAADSRPLVLRAADRHCRQRYGVLFTPAFALIADGAEHSRLAQGMAFGFMNAAWAVGA